MNCQASWVDVLVDCVYTQGLFTYLVPSNLDVQPGDIVMVGFGEQQLGAIAIRRSLELPDGIDPQQVRPVEARESRPRSGHSHRSRRRLPL